MQTANADGLPTFCAKEWLDQMVIKSTFTGAKAKVLASFTSGVAKAKKWEAAAAELAPGKYLNCGHTWHSVTCMPMVQLATSARLALICDLAPRYPIRFVFAWCADADAAQELVFEMDIEGDD